MPRETSIAWCEIQHRVYLSINNVFEKPVATSFSLSILLICLENCYTYGLKFKSWKTYGKICILHTCFNKSYKFFFRLAEILLWILAPTSGLLTKGCLFCFVLKTTLLYYFLTKSCVLLLAFVISNWKFFSEYLTCFLKGSRTHISFHNSNPFLNRIRLFRKTQLQRIKRYSTTTWKIYQLTIIDESSNIYNQ